MACKWCGLKESKGFSDFCSERCKHEYANAKKITPEQADGSSWRLIVGVFVIIFLIALYKTAFTKKSLGNESPTSSIPLQNNSTSNKETINRSNTNQKNDNVVSAPSEQSNNNSDLVSQKTQEESNNNLSSVPKKNELVQSTTVSENQVNTNESIDNGAYDSFINLITDNLHIQTHKLDSKIFYGGKAHKWSQSFQNEFIVSCIQVYKEKFNSTSNASSICSCMIDKLQKNNPEEWDLDFTAEQIKALAKYCK